MEADTERDIIEVCGHAGKILLESGAETARVESTVEYIGRAAGIDISCHAEMTAIFVDASHNPTTHLVKVRTGDFNLQKVDEIDLGSGCNKYQCSRYPNVSGWLPPVQSRTSGRF